MSGAQWKKICCAVDFSETSRAALRLAVDLTCRLGAEITLLNVMPVGLGSVVATPDMTESVTRAAERLLSEWKAEAEVLGAREVTATLSSGDPAAVIVGFAAEGEYDLVVMGTHGRTGLRHAMLGSVAEKVIRKSRCPVLTVNPSWQEGAG